MFDKLKETLQGFFKMVKSKSIMQSIKIQPAISSEMADAIELWDLMYRGKAPWLHEPTHENPVKIVSLGLPAIIASEKARTATLELKSSISDPATSEQDSIRRKSRAYYLDQSYQTLIENIRKELELGIATGGLVIKPYYNKSKEGIAFSFCYADSFYPIAFNSSKEIVEAAFAEQKTVGKNVYTRIEWHKLEKRVVTVRNLVFEGSEGTGRNSLGKQTSLSVLPDWSELQEETQNCDRLLFAYFSMPEANTIDPYSPMGASGYSRAVKLIREADLIFSDLLWEYEAGQIAIDVDRTALSTEHDSQGRDITQLSQLQRRLYRKVDLNAEDTYHPFAPALRDTSILNGLNSTLMRIEDATALSRGTLADVSAEARTATELKILKQRSYQANHEIQQALQRALEDAVKVMNIECDLYDLAPSGDYEIAFEWDDSILTDIATELDQRLLLLDRGIEGRLGLRMWYYGETKKQAEDALAEIDQEDEKQEEEPFGEDPPLIYSEAKDT